MPKYYVFTFTDGKNTYTLRYSNAIRARAEQTYRSMQGYKILEYVKETDKKYDDCR